MQFESIHATFYKDGSPSFFVRFSNGKAWEISYIQPVDFANLLNLSKFLWRQIGDEYQTCFNGVNPDSFHSARYPLSHEDACKAITERLMPIVAGDISRFPNLSDYCGLH
jgi:hypothetical protein